jgi:metallo-beta-lactamase family protein
MKESEPLKLTFCGGTGEATGANFLLTDGVTKIVVDCGLHQGSKFADDANRDPFLYEPSDIHFLLITHAHIDHIGRIPKLIKDGFVGEIISTAPTKIIASLMFDDALKIMEQEARQEGTSALYGRVDVEKALGLWRTVSYHEVTALNESVSVYFRDSGHVLGSAMIEVQMGGKKILFTGDLGNSPSSLLPDTEEITGVDYMVMESVYGDRNHEMRGERREMLKRVILEGIARGGAIIIPAFALEKTQVLLYELNVLVERNQLPQIPVFLDSPLAIHITDVYRHYPELFNEVVRKEISAGDDVFSFPKLRFTPKMQQSVAIEETPNPKIIIAGSGMSNGGRILNHERMYLSDPTSTFLLVGYQAVGTLGRQIQAGEKRVSINNSVIPVKAVIETISGYSSHKDSDRLVDFVTSGVGTLKKVFVVMGEPKSSLFLTQRLREYLNVDAVAPESGQTVTLE